MPGLSVADRAALARDGYVVIRELVPPALCAAVVDAIWEFLEMDRNDPADWYRAPLTRGGLVEMYQHPALWNVRQHPAVHRLFADLCGTERLWVSLDRASLKPPRRKDRPEWDHPGFIHWDVDPRRGPHDWYQGVVCLTPTGADQGGFQCVPELYRALPGWLDSQAAGADPHRPDLTGFSITPVPGETGDLILWRCLLPHGSGRNTSDRPRLAQYVTMAPARPHDAAEREHRIRCWRERIGPGGAPFPGDPRGWEAKRGRTAELTPLGRRLLGVEDWPEDGAGETQ